CVSFGRPDAYLGPSALFGSVDPSLHAGSNVSVVKGRRDERRPAKARAAWVGGEQVFCEGLYASDRVLVAVAVGYHSGLVGGVAYSSAGFFAFSLFAVCH